MMKRSVLLVLTGVSLVMSVSCTPRDNHSLLLAPLTPHGIAVYRQRQIAQVRAEYRQGYLTEWTARDRIAVIEELCHDAYEQR